MLKFLIYIFIYPLVSSNLFSQNPIFPFIPVSFEGEEFMWSSVAEDLSRDDGVRYDGRNHLSEFNIRLRPLQQDKYIYAVNSGTFSGGLDGALVSKRDIEDGTVIWSTPFDIRTSAYRELPAKFYINKNNEFEVISYAVVDSTENGGLTFGLSTLCLWNIKRFDLKTGDLLENIRIDDPELNFEFSVLNSSQENFIFESDGGYLTIRISRGFIDENYEIYYLDEDFNIVSTETIFLDFPDVQTSSRKGGVLASSTGYCSFDVKFGVSSMDSTREYNLYLWDNNFSLVDSIPQSVLEDVFGEYIFSYSLVYFDENNIIVSSSNQEQSKMYILDYNGNIKLSYEITSLYIGFDPISECIVSGNIEDNGAVEELIIYSECASGQRSISLASELPDSELSLRTGSVLASGDIVLRTEQFKGFLDNNGVLDFAFHASEYVSIDGVGLGLLSNTFEQELAHQIDLEIFPNPSSGTFHINLEEELKSISVYNYLGQGIYYSNGTSKRLELSHLEAGAYFIVIETVDQGIATEKIQIFD